jgi:hypothetical protein
MKCTNPHTMALSSWRMVDQAETRFNLPFEYPILQGGFSASAHIRHGIRDRQRLEASCQRQCKLGLSPSQEPGLSDNSYTSC